MENMQINIELSNYRELEYTHPDKQFNSFRWKLTFKIPNPDFIDDDDDDEYLFLETHATSYSKNKTMNKEVALADIKRSLFCTYKTFYEVSDDRVKEQLKETMPATLGCHVNDIDMVETSSFIKNFNPSKRYFSIDEMQALEQYRYIFYSTQKLMDTLIGNNIEDITIFQHPDDFLEWLGYESLEDKVKNEKDYSSELEPNL